MIRQVTASDVNDLVYLRIQLLRETGNLSTDADEAPLQEAIRSYLTQAIANGSFIAWVAEENGAIVASSGLVWFQRPPSVGNLMGLEAYIMNMYSLPEWRGKGLATALLNEIIGRVKATSARRIWLLATPNGKRIYQRAGFVVQHSKVEVAMELVW